MLARENIIEFNNQKLPKFPDKFDNEIYISNGKTNNKTNPVEYISNFSLKYIVEGKEDYVVQGKRKSIEKDKILLINDQCSASFIGSDAKAVSIFINPDVFIDCQKPLLDKRGFLVTPFDKHEDTIEFFDSVQKLEHYGLIKKLSRIVNYPELVITQDFYYELATEIILSQNRLQRKINKIDSIKHTTRREIFKKLEMAKDYLNDNLNQSFDLDVVSEISCISKFHFIRVFKEVYGVTPHRYHLQRKFVCIRKQIVQKSDSISLRDVANDFGFSNYSVFYKQFKQLHGESPTMYLQSKDVQIN